MSSDTDVMRYYPTPWPREQSDAFAQRVMRLIDERGWGFGAIEELASRQFIGFVGLHIPSHELPFTVGCNPWLGVTVVFASPAWQFTRQTP